MIKNKIYFTFVFCLVSILPVLAQSRLGEWTDYQSYAHAIHVVDAGDKIYSVTEGGLFSYNKADNSIQKMSGINGLSDVGVSRLAYNKEKNVFLIAYQNANIDLLIGNQIYNLSDIKRKQIPAEKIINNVMFFNGDAYLSCGFGIVVINLDRKEIKDTYFIGQEGAFVNVQDMATDGIYFYAATTNGIYKSLVNSPNLQDFANWVKQVNMPHAEEKFSKIEEFNGKVIASYTPDNGWAENELYIVNEISITRFLPQIGYVSDMVSNENYLVISEKEEVNIFDKDFQLVKYIPKFLFPDNKVDSLSSSGAIIDEQNIIWVADRNNGLIKIGTSTEKIVPEGPIDNKIFSMTMNGTDLWIAPGGRDNAWNNLFTRPQFQLNREGKWSVFNNKNSSVFNFFVDIIAIAVDPKNPDHVFAGSWGGGVIEMQGGNVENRHTNLNSSLQTQLPQDPNAPYVRIGGMDFDSRGDLWVSNSGVGKVLSVYHLADKEWESFELKGIANSPYVSKMVVTQNNDKWVTMGRGQSMYVLNSDNDLVKEQKLIAYFSNGREELYTNMNDVGAIAEDKNGELWVGTNGGVAVFTNPSSIWDDSPMYATRPGLNLNDGIYHPLLEKESITAIAIDGANRKWIGTKHSGVFLISENGETEINHFTPDNSPLPANDVTDIAINQKSGEVFISTGSGLISYRGQATEGTDNYDDVYAYPNPVREDYEGPVVIKGLLENTDIKITDISGNLVYHTTSLGGQAIWNGKTLNGNRCKTGVYLVFMNDETGETTKVTKILFIH